MMTALVQTYQQQTMTLPYHHSTKSSYGSPTSGTSVPFTAFRGGSPHSPAGSYKHFSGSPLGGVRDDGGANSPPSLRRDHRSPSAPLLDDGLDDAMLDVTRSTQRHSSSSASAVAESYSVDQSQGGQYAVTGGKLTGTERFLGSAAPRNLPDEPPTPPVEAPRQASLSALSPPLELHSRSGSIGRANQVLRSNSESMAPLTGSAPPSNLSSFAPFGFNVNLGAGIHTPDTLAQLSRGQPRPVTAADDMPMYKRATPASAHSKDRRRSIGSLDRHSHVDAGMLSGPIRSLGQKSYSRNAVERSQPREIPFMSTRALPVSSTPTELAASSQRSAEDPSRHGSTDSMISKPAAPDNLTVKQEIMLPAQQLRRATAQAINIPPRASSEVTKKLDQDGETQLETRRQQSVQPSSTPMSPALQKLSEVETKDRKKPGKSRLRRAFSFGSAAELRRVTAENNMSRENVHPSAKLTKERPLDDLENDPVSQQQEAGGLGKSIYSGQGNFHLGSTDNLSISSTASSASLMMRKMGRGVKKGSRSLVGLFRPKSVIGVPPMGARDEGAGVGEVSIVNIEAERERVNVNVDPHDQPGGGTGFPKLEKASGQGIPRSAETRVRGSLSTETNRSRRSFVGADGERAEVLASIKKGILKRTATGTSSGQSSPSLRPTDGPSSVGNTPFHHPATETPKSSQPSTPTDERPSHMGHKRSGTTLLDDESYFATLPKVAAATDNISVNGSLAGGVRFNVKFSPRIEFHDTWPSLEYDRRGEIATCNKLTPMLAAQIKEELNTFKMEMEVHEQSKVYTHFF